MHIAVLAAERHSPWAACVIVVVVVVVAVMLMLLYLYTRGVQKVRSLTQKTTIYVNINFSVFNINSYN